MYTAVAFLYMYLVGTQYFLCSRKSHLCRCILQWLFSYQNKSKRKCNKTSRGAKFSKFL